MTLQDNDQFMVDRGNTPYSVNSQTLVAKLQDSDLMLVCRNGTPYKATGAEIKDSLGSGSINPGLNDITLDPATPGSGTEADPYILQTKAVAPYGSTTESVETITITDQPPEASVVWRDNSVDAGNRFAQVTGELTDANGVWTGKLEYADIPDSTEDVTYVGKLNIGLVYFQWSIVQLATASAPPAVDSVSLIESSPAEGNRFTSESFVASSQVTDGLPIATKTFDAHVDGTLTKTVKFTEPLNSQGTTSGPNYSSLLTCAEGFQPGGPASRGFDGDLNEPPYSNANTSSTESPRITWDCSSYGFTDTDTVELWFLSNGSWVEFIDTNGTVVGGPRGNVTANTWWAPDTGAIPNLAAITTYNKTTQAGGISSSWAAGVRVNGTILIDGQQPALPTLVFPANADMEGLANGDEVSQVSNFTEPLESQGTTPVTLTVVNTGTATTNPVAPGSNAFDGNTASEWVVYISSGGTGTVDIPPQENTTGKVYLWLNNAYGGGYTWTLVINGTDEYTLGTIDSNASQKLIDITPTVVTSIGLKGFGGSNPALLAIDLNAADAGSATPLNLTGMQITALTFPAATDMAALSPGDDVSQAGKPGVQPDYSVTGTWAVSGRWGSDPSTSVTNKGWSFDGNLNTGAGSPNTFNGGDQGECTWTAQSAIPVLNGLTLYLMPAANMPFLTYLIAVNDANLFYPDQIYITTGPDNTQKIDLSYLNLTELTSLKLNYSNSSGNSTQYPQFFTGIEVDGQLLLNGAPYPAPSGTVGSITGTTATLSSSSGAWTNGVDVTTGDKTTTGTVSGVSGTTATLSSSSGGWANGLNVVGPQKTIVEENARLYCAFDSNGNITDLQNNPQDPPYTTQASNPGLTFTFPATFPSGQTPDEELPDGTTFTVEVSAENSAGTSGPISATVQPDPEPPPEPDRDPKLVGLTTLYPGNAASQTITNGIDLVNNDGLVWVKNRTGGNQHGLTDTITGPSQYLASNTQDPIGGTAFAITSFRENGFTLGADATVNGNNSNYVAWTFGKAAGYFDVVKFTASNANAFQTIPHSLGTKPGFIITKQIDGAGNWHCYHSAIGDGGYIVLNQPGTTSVYDSWRTSNTDFQISSSGFYGSGPEVIAYLFAEDNPGVIKCGLTGAAGTQVECGFRPQWVLIKARDEVFDWAIADNKRPTNPQLLFPNNSNVESYNDNIVFNDTGFTQQWATDNAIYVAIAAPDPIPVPQGTLEGLTTIYSGSGGTNREITNGIDLLNNGGLTWCKSRNGPNPHVLVDTVRGTDVWMASNMTDGDIEDDDNSRVTSFNTNGVTLGTRNTVNGDPSATYVNWTFGKAAGYFDVVQFISDGSSMQTVPHSLGTKPGFIITKALDTSDWRCYHSSLGNDSYTLLNMPYSKQDLVNSWQTSDTEFGTDSNNFWMPAGTTVIAYLFAEDNPGVIKCGSYTGVSGTTPTIATGFKPQWILIKSEDSFNWNIFDSKRGAGPVLFPNEPTNEQFGGPVNFVSNGFNVEGNDYNTNADGATYIYVAIAEPPTARSMTNEEYVESQAKFLTYDNRKQVKQGEEALEDREAVIKQAADLGLDLDLIKKNLNL